MNSPERSAAPTTGRQLGILGVIVLVGLLLRVAYLLHAIHSAGFTWEDPDGYIAHALRLVRHGRWAWTFAATTHSINGQQHALPPGYTVFLSLFAMFPAFPLTAQLAQVLLAVLSIPLVFALGRHVHSATAGLIAAGCYAAWAPNILNPWSTSQETLYIPMILASFVLLARAINRDSSAFEFAAAGLMFGVAALTRSMPLFFVGPAALMHATLAAAPDRRRVTAQGVALLAGFLIVVVPYSVALSRSFGTVTIIDTHGSIHLEASENSRVPSLIDTTRALGRTVAASPGQYFHESIGRPIAAAGERWTNPADIRGRGHQGVRGHMEGPDPRGHGCPAHICRGARADRRGSLPTPSNRGDAAALDGGQPDHRKRWRFRRRSPQNAI